MELLRDMNERIAAVVLAAGESSRMARQKLMLDWGGLTIIQRVIDSILQAGITHICVVTGPEDSTGTNNIKRSVSEFCSLPDVNNLDPVIRFVGNPDPSRGMASSFFEGVMALQPWERWEAVILALGDQPEGRADVILELVTTYSNAKGEYKVVQPIHHGKKGHPILMATEVLPGVLELRPEQQLRELFWPWSEQRHYIEVADRGILIDIDTDEDYRAHRPQS